MKKIILIVVMLLILLLSACGVSDTNIQEKIVAPENKTTPIQGKWVIKEKVYITEDDGLSNDIVLEEDNIDNYLGREVLFHKDAIVVGEDYVKNPTFKLINVNTIDYLLYKYKVNPSSLDITSDTIQVISSLNNNQIFYEFVKYNEDNLLVYINNSFYKLERVAEEVSAEEVNRYINIESNMMMTLDTIEVEDMDSGVLLGIKIPIYDEEKEISDWEYKTIWIRNENRSISKYELDRLLVPRKNGFWIINVDRDETDSIINDRIVAVPQFTKVDSKELKEDIEVEFFRSASKPSIGDKQILLKDILFVGNDYISVEKTDISNKNKKTLEIYTLDNIEEERPIKLSDIVDNGEFLYNEGSQNFQSLGENVVFNQSNVGLTRTNGYWILKGRVNYRQNDEELYKDFNIKTIPPKTMVSYDELSISWDLIKSQFPDALDGFTSPNGDLLIITTGNELQIYPTDMGEILRFEPIARIQIPNIASIIMSEWALGRYAEIWENEMINQGALIIE